MDGRPHKIVLIEYQELWGEAAKLRRSADSARFENEKSGQNAGVTGISAGVRVELRQDYSDSDSSGEKIFGEEKVLLRDHGEYRGWEQGFRCGEAELARAQSAANAAEVHEEIRILGNPIADRRRTDAVRSCGAESSALGFNPSDYSCSKHLDPCLKFDRDYNICEDGSRTAGGGNNVAVPNLSSNLLDIQLEGGGDIARNVTRVLGRTGPGLLAVRGVPQMAELRKRLLPLAKKLALMPDVLRRLVLKEHDLCTDVPLKSPDRPVSAFATQLRYGSQGRLKTVSDNTFRSNGVSSSSPSDNLNSSEARDEKSPTCNNAMDNDLEELGGILRQLGECMVDIGILVARLCDSVIPGAELEDAIWEAGTAKGRLVHYHAQSESKVMSLMSSKTKNGLQKKAQRQISKASQAGTTNFHKSKSAKPGTNLPQEIAGHGTADLWQQWHYDYGLLTVLTSPMFLSMEFSEPSVSEMFDRDHIAGHNSGLKILHQGVSQYVSIPPDCLIVQVGEAAQILSGGNLAATAHCVSRPPQADVSRETFVVFLQPAWHRSLSPPRGFVREAVLNLRNGGLCSLKTNQNTHSDAPVYSATQRPDFQDEEDCCQEGVTRTARQPEHYPSSLHGFNQYHQLLQAVPALASRWSDGCSFAEFSKVTTQKYYGANGSQPQK